MTDAVDPTFLDDLEQSHDAVWAVARYLWSRGAEVAIPPVAVRPTDSERMKYGDCGDLRWRRSNELAWARGEVKARKVRFHDAEDFPYPTIFVDVAHKVRKDGPASAYFMLNQDWARVGIIRGSSLSEWTLRKTWDKGRNREFYEAPLTCVEFRDFGGG